MHALLRRRTVGVWILGVLVLSALVLAQQPNVNVAQSNGAGAADSGTQRVVLSSDSAVAIGSIAAGTNNIGDVDVASIAAGDTNIGNVDLASAIPAGTAIIGKVGIDQTTPGTTNGVQVNAALPAGTNAIGKLAANSGVDIGDVDVTSMPAATDPCQSPYVAKSSVVIDVATNDAELIALTASQVIYVCGWSLTVNGTAPTWRLIYGTGSVCAGGLTALTGTFLPIVGSFATFAGPGTVTKTIASNALCMDVGGTTPSVQGVLTYVKQ